MPTTHGAIPAGGPGPAGGSWSTDPVGLDIQKYYYDKYQVPASGGADPYWSDYNRRMQEVYGGRADVKADDGYQANAAEYQKRLIASLHDAARGDWNSSGQKSLAAGYDNARGQVQTAATMRRGVGAGAALRDARGKQDQLKGEQAGQSFALLLQEQRAAQAALAQLYTQQRELDAQHAAQTAQNQLQNQAVNNQAQQGAVGAGIGGDIATTQYQHDLGAANVGLDLESADFNRRYGQALAGMGAGAVGAAASIFGAGGRHAGSGNYGGSGRGGGYNYGYSTQDRVDAAFDDGSDPGDWTLPDDQEGTA